MENLRQSITDRSYDLNSGVSPSKSTFYAFFLFKLLSFKPLGQNTTQNKSFKQFFPSRLLLQTGFVWTLPGYQNTINLRREDVSVRIAS